MKKIRQIRSFNLVLSLVETLLSRNFCQDCVKVKFRNFHSVIDVNVCLFLSENSTILLSMIFYVKSIVAFSKTLDLDFDESMQCSRE